MDSDIQQIIKFQIPVDTRDVEFDIFFIMSIMEGIIRNDEDFIYDEILDITDDFFEREDDLLVEQNRLHEIYVAKRKVLIAHMRPVLYSLSKLERRYTLDSIQCYRGNTVLIFSRTRIVNEHIKK